MNPDTEPSDTDAKIRARLARLANLAPDTRSLEARLERAIADEAADAPAPYRFAVRRWLMGGVAAAVMIGLSVSLLTVMPARAARAITVAELIEAHEGALIDHTEHLMPVSTIAQADDALRSAWAQAPRLPVIGGAEPFACCVHHFGNEPAACLHLRLDGKPVSVVAADLSSIAPPTEAASVVPAGQGRWRVYRRDPYTVVAGTIDDRCVCVVGEHGPDRLLALVESIRFDSP